MRNFEYKKNLGQNFLNDKNIIEKIINNVEYVKNSLIIEIGPGTGALTSYLSKLDTNVICFEIDTRLKETLSKYETGNLKIIYEDILKVNLKEYVNNYDKIIVIGNLPYYITTPIIKKVTYECNPDEVIVMIQKEVGERFISKPNNKLYSSISVFLQYNYDVNKICVVNKKCFYPIPKVDSVVIKLIKRNKEKITNYELFEKIVKDSFMHKRKNLKNNLSNYDQVKLLKLLNDVGKDLSYRAENLSVSDYVYISNNIN